MKKILFLLSGLLILQMPGFAQIVPVQNQFIANPYVYNPAWAGKSGYMQLNASFRKQWWGLEGSPSLSTLFFEMPLDDRISIGGNLVNQSEGPLNSLTTHLTGSYRLPLGYDEDEHYLSFGMSWGIRYNSLNTNKIDDPDDPAIAQLGQSSFSLDGSVGFAYKYNNLEIGLSSPRLSEGRPLSEEGFNSVSLRPWYRFISSAAYRFELGYGDFAITPTLLYHYDQDFNNQVEGIIKGDYLDQYWAGLGYRQELGFQALVGMDINETLSFAYFHNFGSNSTFIPNNTSEIMLTVRLGAKRRGVQKARDFNTSSSEAKEIEENPEENKPEVEKETKITEKEESGLLALDESISLDNYDESIEIRLAYDADKVYGRTIEGNIFDVEPTHYFIAGQYKYLSDAKEKIDFYRAKGLRPRTVYNSSEKQYFLYLGTKERLEDARRIVLGLRKLKGFEEAKLLILE